MIRVIVKQRDSQPDCWYIDVVSDNCVDRGKVCYRSLSEARAVAKKKNPYVCIEVEP
jgi:hypothetical protein